MAGSHETEDGHRDHARDRYGLVFGLLLAGFIIAGVLTIRQARVVTTLLYATALVFALRSSHLPRRTVRLVRWGLLAGSVVVVVLVAVLPGRTIEGLAALWAAAVLVFTVVVIVVRVLHHRVVTMQTVLGALSAYLLIGFVFTALFTATATLSSRPLFAHGDPATGSAIQYFAFITLTTTGYGDLVPAGQPGRSLAALEALSGQIFLVTLVARLVSVFGTARRRPRDDVPDA